MTVKRICTCCKGHPWVFDLTEPFLKSQTVTQEVENDEEVKEMEMKFRSTLAHYGWALIQLRPSTLQRRQKEQEQQQQYEQHCSSSTSTFSIPFHLMGQDPSSWKLMLHDLFEKTTTSTAAKNTCPNTTTASPPPGGIYRQAESGSPTSGDGRESILEPKESWEVQRCYHTMYNDLTNQEEKKHDVDPVCHPRHEQPHQQHVLYEWIELLHQIAITVRKCLGLPKNILLQEEPLHCHGSHNHPYGHCESLSSSSTTRTAAESLEVDDESNCSDRVGVSSSSNTRSRSNHVGSIDLLRAFYYHTVPQPQARTQGPCLGSSPHTDWGSFTVVWQDHVGGLETFCHACQTWNHVHPMMQIPNSKDMNDMDDDDNKNNHETSKSNEVPFTFVVHVSDITSLALRLAVSNLVTTTSTMMDWPSPRHRVVSPVDETRVSLVYFAYPPPDISLAKVVKALQEQQQQQQPGGGQGGSASMMEQMSSESGNGVSRKATIVLEDYSLLQNQSSTASNSSVHVPPPLSPKDQLDHILHLPLREVLMDKWNQVQRTID